MMTRMTSHRRLPGAKSCPCCELDAANRARQRRGSKKEDGRLRANAVVSLEKLGAAARRCKGRIQSTHHSEKSTKKTPAKAPVAKTGNKTCRKGRSSGTGNQPPRSEPPQLAGRRRGRPRGVRVKPWPAGRVVIGAGSLLLQPHRPVTPDPDPAAARRLAARRPCHDMCSICGLEERRFSALRRHVQLQHGLVTCGRCRLCFSSRSRLLRHRRLADEPLGGATEPPLDVAPSGGRRLKGRGRSGRQVAVRSDGRDEVVREDAVADGVLVVFFITAVVCCVAHVSLLRSPEELSEHGRHLRAIAGCLRCDPCHELVLFQSQAVRREALLRRR